MKHQCGFCKKPLHSTYETDAKMFCSIDCMIHDGQLRNYQPFEPWHTRLYWFVHNIFKRMWQ